VDGTIVAGSRHAAADPSTSTPSRRTVTCSTRIASGVVGTTCTANPGPRAWRDASAALASRLSVAPGTTSSNDDAVCAR
jgi:hypothetical protein